MKNGRQAHLASIEEVRAGIALANDKASESMGALQQAHASLEQAQSALLRVTEGSNQADVSEANGLLAQAVGSIEEVATGLRRDRGVRGRREPPVIDPPGGSNTATDSLGEVRVVLADVAEQINERLPATPGSPAPGSPNAVAVLTDLDPSTPRRWFRRSCGGPTPSWSAACSTSAAAPVSSPPSTPGCSVVLRGPKRRQRISAASTRSTPPWARRSGPRIG